MIEASPLDRCSACGSFALVVVNTVATAWVLQCDQCGRLFYRDEIGVLDDRPITTGRRPSSVNQESLPRGTNP